MKKLLLILLSSVLLLAGCSTVDARIKQRSSYFYSLDAKTQERLKKGEIHIGDTTDMVFIAVGHPDRVREKTTSAGQETTWVYTSTHEEYEGARFVGFERHTYVDRRGRMHMGYHPVAADVYGTYTDEYLRIIFRDGKAVSVEQESGD